MTPRPPRTPTAEKKVQTISDWVDIMILRAPPPTGDAFDDHITLVEKSVAPTLVQIAENRKEIEFVAVAVAAELLRRVIDTGRLP